MKKHTFVITLEGKLVATVTADKASFRQLMETVTKEELIADYVRLIGSKDMEDYLNKNIMLPVEYSTDGEEYVAQFKIMSTVNYN